MNGTLYIGTSGWSYKHWKEMFYPPKTKAGDYLKFYSAQFNTTEINTSFYHLPKPDYVKRWYEATPDDFKFSPKLSRYVTHMKKLNDAEEPLERFFSIFDQYRDKIGTVLIQLPPSLVFHIEVVEPFLQLLKMTYGEYSFSIEPRNVSWFAEEPVKLLKAYKVPIVISQSGGVFPYYESDLGDHVYYRFHGPKKLFDSKYEEEMLRVYAVKCKQHLLAGKDVYCYFNNDGHGFAVDDAKRLLELTSL